MIKKLTLPVSRALSTPDEGYVRVWFQAGGYFSYQFAGKYGESIFSTDFPT